MRYKHKLIPLVVCFGMLLSPFLQTDISYASIPPDVLKTTAEVTDLADLAQNGDNANTDNQDSSEEAAVLGMEPINNISFDGDGSSGDVSSVNTQTWDSGSDTIWKDISVTDEVTRFEIFYSKDCKLPNIQMQDDKRNVYELKNTSSESQSIVVYENQSLEGYEDLLYAVVYIANPNSPGNWKMSITKDDTYKELFIVQSEVPSTWNTSDIYKTTPKNMVCYYFAENSKYSANDIMSIAEADQRAETEEKDYEEVEPVTGEQASSIGLVLIGLFIVIILAFVIFMYSQKNMADKKEREEGAKRRSVKKKYTNEEDKERLEKFMDRYDEEYEDDDFDGHIDYEDDEEEDDDFSRKHKKPNPLAYDGFNEGFDDSEYEEENKKVAKKTAKKSGNTVEKQGSKQGSKQTEKAKKQPTPKLVEVSLEVIDDEDDVEVEVGNEADIQGYTYRDIDVDDEYDEYDEAGGNGRTDVEVDGAVDETSEDDDMSYAFDIKETTETTMKRVPRQQGGATSIPGRPKVQKVSIPQGNNNENVQRKAGKKAPVGGNSNNGNGNKTNTGRVTSNGQGNRGGQSQPNSTTKPQNAGQNTGKNTGKPNTPGRPSNNPDKTVTNRANTRNNRPQQADQIVARPQKVEIEEIDLLSLQPAAKPNKTHGQVQAPKTPQNNNNSTGNVQNSGNNANKNNVRNGNNNGNGNDSNNPRRTGNTGIKEATSTMLSPSFKRPNKPNPVKVGNEMKQAGAQRNSQNPQKAQWAVNQPQQKGNMQGNKRGNGVVGENSLNGQGRMNGNKVPTGKGVDTPNAQSPQKPQVSPQPGKRPGPGKGSGSGKAMPNIGGKIGGKVPNKTNRPTDTVTNIEDSFYDESLEEMERRIEEAVSRPRVPRTGARKPNINVGGSGNGDNGGSGKPPMQFI